MQEEWMWCLERLIWQSHGWWMEVKKCWRPEEYIDWLLQLSPPGVIVIISSQGSGSKSGNRNEKKQTILKILWSTISCFSHVRLFANLWTIARQSPLFMGFSRQEYWSMLPCPPPGNLPDPGLKPTSLTFPALAGRFFTTSNTWETH